MIFNRFALFVFACFGALNSFANRTAESMVRFTENLNQWESPVLFKARFGGADIFIEKKGFTVLLMDERVAHLMHRHPEGPEGKSDQASDLKFHALKFTWENASSPLFTKGETFEGYYNYFQGNDRSKWASGVRSYKEIKARGLYSGTDLIWYSKGAKPVYDLELSPGADPGALQLRIDGATGIEKTGQGLVIHTGLGDLFMEKPVAYQEENGRKIYVPCEYKLRNNLLSFEFKKGYNKHLKLVIDPVLSFSTFSGSTIDNWGFTATYDTSGNAYGGGIAFGTGYPVTAGAFQTTFAGGGTGGGNPAYFKVDMSITKWNSTGTALIYSTFLGGSDNEQPHSLFVNENNELIIYGRSYSANYPVSASAYDNTINGGSDIVVTKLNAAGTALLASTFVGGSLDDAVNFSSVETVIGDLKYNYADDARGEVIADAAGNVYIATCTKSFDFPVTPGCFQNASGGLQDGCVFKLDPNLSTLLFSSYIGGANNDAAYSINLNSTGEMYIAGGTRSNNLPTTGLVIHSTFQGGPTDGFIYHINAAGTTMLQGSYIGTTGLDQVYFVQVDGDDDVYLLGQTGGPYPVSPGVYSNPGSGQFIHKLSPNLSTTIYSTVFGSGRGNPDISPTAFLVDRCENVYVTGWGGPLYGYNVATSSTSGLPVTSDAYKSTTDGKDLYFFILRKNAVALAYATFFGGALSQEHVDGGTCRFDKNGIIYQAVCGGCGGLSDMPTSAGAWSNTNKSTNCNFGMVKFKFDLTETKAVFDFLADTLGCIPFVVDFANSSSGYLSFEWDFGDGTTNTTDTFPTHTYYTPGTYTVELRTYNPNTCNERDTARKLIYVRGPFAIAKIGDKDICKGDSVFLDATYVEAVSYNWSPSSGLSGTSTPTVWAKPTATTSYVVVINDGICAVNDTSTVTVHVNSVNIDTPDGLLVCQGGEVRLRCGPGTYSSYLWNTGSTSSNITVSTPGWYVLETEDTYGCSAKDSVEFKIEPDFVLKAGPDTGICKGSSVQLYARGAKTYTWSPPFYISDTTIANPVSIPDTSITYKVVGVGDLCSHTATVKIGVLPYPRISAGNDIEVMRGEEVRLVASGDSLVEWIPWNVLSCRSCYSPILRTDTMNQTFIVVAANRYGCKTTDTVNVYFEDEPAIFIPNAFTPNKDEPNEIFRPVTLGMKQVKGLIFNRWGEQIYEWNDINGGWDGTYKGQPAKQDVYIYIIEAYTLKNKPIIRTGNVTLLR